MEHRFRVIDVAGRYIVRPGDSFLRIPMVFCVWVWKGARRKREGTGREMEWEENEMEKERCFLMLFLVVPLGHRGRAAHQKG